MKIYILTYLILAFLISCQNGTINSLTPLSPESNTDTTSHNFTWEIYPLGDLASTVWDVTLLEYDRFLVCGHIYGPQSSEGNTYNAVEFDNYDWNYSRIPSKYFDGQWGFSTILAILSFDINNVWGFTTAGSYVRLEDTTWTSEMVWEAKGSIYAIWGPSSNHVYFAGTNGNITRLYDNEWHLLSTTTEVNLLDIWGSENGKEVWACGHEGNYSKSALLRVNLNKAEIVWQYPDENSNYPYESYLNSLYFKNDHEILLTGNKSIYNHNIQTSVATKLDVQLSSFPAQIKGSAENNIFVAGQDGMVVHFNGSTWKEYKELYNPGYVYRSISCSENQVVITGNDYSQGVQRGVVLIGNRKFQ